MNRSSLLPAFASGLRTGRRFYVSTLLVFPLLTGCGVIGLADDRADVALISPDREAINLRVEIASTPEEQKQGLMMRKSLGEKEGMLFSYPSDRQLSFWMKNTLIPLDIIFFNGDGWWVADKTMEPCKEDPCRLYSSQRKARFALEVNKGFVEEHNVGKGWRLGFSH